MKRTTKCIIGCALAAAMLLTSCRGSSSSGSSGGSTSGSTVQEAQQAAWKTGLGVVTEMEADSMAGSISTAAAAVLLDEDGKIAQVVVDEMEIELSSDGSGLISAPTTYYTKRERGDSYGLGNASSIGKEWHEQADAFGKALTGMSVDDVEKLKIDDDGHFTDTDLLSGCTIAVDTYRDAVLKACANAEALGAAEGDTLSIGLEAESDADGMQATDDADVMAEFEITFAVVTANAEGRVTSAICDMTEPALTVSSDGGMTAADDVMSKLEMGDDYGMKKASTLSKEWYEHSEGFADYLKGKTAEQIEGIPTDGSDADLASVCTINITVMQKAVLKALDQ